jgi:hypothetical protein
MAGPPNFPPTQGHLMPGQVSLPMVPGMLAPGAMSMSYAYPGPAPLSGAGMPSAARLPASAAGVTPSGVPLTGNAAADADIMAFYKAKDELMKRTKSGGSSGFAGVLAEAANASATMSSKK